MTAAAPSPLAPSPLAPSPLARAAAALAEGSATAALALLDGAEGASVALLRARARWDLGAPEAAAALVEPHLDGAPPAFWAESAPILAAAGRGGPLGRRARTAGLPDAAARAVATLATGRGMAAQGTGGVPAKDLARLAEAPPASVVAALGGRSGGAVALLLAKALTAQGNRRAAAEALARAVRAEPFALDLRLAFAEALRAAGHPQALREARSATWIAPRAAAVHLTRADLAADHPDEALRHAETALRLAPREARARRAAHRAALVLGEGEAALAHARALPAAERPAAEARALTRLGRDAEAAKLLESLADPDARVAAAQAWRTAGDEAAAAAGLRAVLAERPDHDAAWHALAQGGHATAADVATMEALAAPPRLALAKAVERRDPARAFDHLAAAKAEVLAAHPHDPAADRAAWEKVKETWGLWGDVRSGSGAAPILVTGLPRSGTTLVEAILAAHPEVRAGGELALLGPALEPVERAMDHGVAPVAGTLTEVADAYARRAAELRPGGGRWTDKSIHSFVRIGPLLRLLPKARIVVVHRDPRDVGLSIWRNAFRPGTHRYSASQTGIAHHAALFQKAVAFWREALPEGAFHEVRYEALVGDPEGESRRLLKACGLAWDAAVLRFHEAAGRVETLSFGQVRRPIHGGSTGGWRAHAGPLREMLDEMARLGVETPD